MKKQLLVLLPASAIGGTALAANPAETSPGAPAARIGLSLLDSFHMTGDPYLELWYTTWLSGAGGWAGARYGAQWGANFGLAGGGVVGALLGASVGAL